MSRHLNFTRSALERIELPATGRLWVYDSKVRGLCLMVTPSGLGSFYAYGRVRGTGKVRRRRLDRFDKLSVEEARGKARIEMGKMQEGVDVNADNRALRNQFTFGQAYVAYLEKHLKLRGKPVSIRETERIYKVHLLADLANRSLAALTTSEIEELHGRIGQANGRIMANHVFEVVRAVVNYARKNMKWTFPNPCDDVTRFPKQERERVLEEAEGKRLRKALDAEGDSDLCDYIELLLETGQRRGNVERMRWSQLDLENGHWLIPGSEFKNGKAQKLTLTKNAVAILKRHARTDDCEFVFTHRDFTRGWRRIRDAAGLVGVTRHDLRRTVGSRLAEAGASEAVIARVLGHSSTQATRVYMRIADQRAKQALESLSGKILGASKQRKAKKAG